MVSIRVDAQRYEVLAVLAAQEGLPPTTMARLLLNRAIREAAHHGSQL
jgi:antitoxin component of RelBE/YafQ-DinJ toxin-antitoxin module